MPTHTARPAQPGRAGSNPLTAWTDLWFSLADLIVAKLLGRLTPRVLEGIRIVPVGQLPNLRSVRLRETIEVDPGTDLFRAAIEERQRIRNRPHDEEMQRTAGELKTLANSGSTVPLRGVPPARPGALGLQGGRPMAFGRSRLESARLKNPANFVFRRLWPRSQPGLGFS